MFSFLLPFQPLKVYLLHLAIRSHGFGSGTIGAWVSFQVELHLRLEFWVGPRWSKIQKNHPTIQFGGTCGKWKCLALGPPKLTISNFCVAYLVQLKMTLVTMNTTQNWPDSLRRCLPWVLISGSEPVCLCGPFLVLKLLLTWTPNWYLSRSGSQSKVGTESNVSGHKDGLQSASLFRDFPSHNMAAIIFGICYMLHSAGFSSQVSWSCSWVVKPN